MSYQYKKSTILYELEQAIKKKVIEKSKHKEPQGKVLQSSIDKKKINRQCYDRQSSKSKDLKKIPSVHLKNEKPLSLFNNENFNAI